MSMCERQVRSKVKGTSDPLELELQAVVNCLLWVLGIKPKCFLQVPPASHLSLAPDLDVLTSGAVYLAF